MLASWGSFTHRRRWVVLVVTLLVTIGAGGWGLGVFDKLTQGGYEDPASESMRVKEIVTETFGQRPPDVVVVYTAPDEKTVDDPALAAQVTTALRGLPRDKVVAVSDYWSTGLPALASAEKTMAMATITLAGTDKDDRRIAYQSVRDLLPVPGVRTQLGGTVPTEQAMNERSADDLTVAEAVSLPVTLVLLVMIFGSVLAASMPVLVGCLSIFGSLGVLRALSYGFEVNSFALNVAILLGLGMAIDYGLFMVGRFREELGAGATIADAVSRTVATAGRTVAFSATLLVIALSGLVVFPMDYLRSMAYGGMSAVAIAAIISLTLLPALLAVAGHRLRTPLGGRHRRIEREFLARVADAVMRRPVLFALPITAVLVALALPLGGLTFGGADEKQLPPDDPSRVTVETIAANFPAASTNQATLVVRAANPGSVALLVEDLKRVPGVLDAVPTGAKDDIALLTVPLAGEANTDAAASIIRALREVPTDADVLVGGYPAEVADTIEAISDRIPWMIAILVAATLVLMFLAFGSVLLPVKAVLMSALSLSATFGILVFVFQDGHGAGLFGVTPQPVQAGLMVLIVAMVFGLSTDYETFLLSRMVEARHTGLSTHAAVHAGLLRTGRMITAAALLLVVVTGAFGLSALASMRFLGVGMIIALVLDATVVRMLLVPAVMRLLGDAAWWAPDSLRRLQEKAGLSEVEPDAPTLVMDRAW
ncbi:putative drug exporter of the RND superfamily [Actinokineospora alba]|uniref:Putative drug exporter of the RND superfamily n=1 Tax=Actinokineospora alba TaxID=504798 RepID=A0A1H0Q8C4_9PSEU|nr:MMPL family transporter [Actinokineospora alba]TDP66101.1 RND superfamily putative drug exporter [Actinokineospora alba]SDI58133.1 putative drug exporter of the RND superfamily [Actinokineospora alba]SDP12938.1 putative drug exporter of the RND superfamily [Actinokineospora alba]